MGSVRRREWKDKKTGQIRKTKNYYGPFHKKIAARVEPRSPAFSKSRASSESQNFWNGPYIRFRDAHGKWRTEPTEHKTRYLAERAMSEREREIAAQINGTPPTLPQVTPQDVYIEEIKVAYLTDARLRYAPSTCDLYKGRIDFTLVELAVERVSELTLEKVDQYVSRRQKADVAPRTINTQILILRRMLGWAVRREWAGLTKNPLNPWRPLKEVRKHKRRAMTPDEAETLLQKSPVHRKIIWAVALASGLRRSELIQIQVSDFHADRALLIVRPEISKSSRRRVVPIPHGLAATLDQWISEDVPHRRNLTREYLAGVRRRLADCEANGTGDSAKADSLRHLEAKICADRRHRCIFRNGRGRPYNGRNLLREFRTDLDKAGIDQKGLDLQALRVTNATLLRRAGVPDIVIKQRLGHVSIATTDRHYVDMDRVDDGGGTDVVAGFLGVSNGTPEAKRPDNAKPATRALSLEDKEPLRPDREILEAMMRRYSNVTIARVFQVSEAAVRKWMQGFGLTRRRHPGGQSLTAGDIIILRAEVRMAQTRPSKPGRRRRTPR